LGRYVLSDEIPGEYVTTFPSVKLRMQENLLLLDPGGSVFLVDTRTGGSNLGFLAGAKRGQGESIRFSEGEGTVQLRCLGRTYDPEAPSH
jgi:hypothetical protein